ncbi:nicotinate-nucleotide pyrophosphorylase [carboxylating] [Desulfonispora thiosulfatigenes DSM 11270]|uniref:Probable nicotinate-nucleotide pyrophosphorylase [carboxylating] n=1 Tax=Desulfonispora thiosulfatigenes DSM 11270 TaxID=656914 RepID=A0A1W1VGA2_DESTI|nr:carboxylating nicotinate-nucleotide diphosphorylase [Desulfonispora thiosulfatigenes]SMB92388.1 nicotinate-nucleotide pyrophosphorylase [carboxylating] [Desulfonispora thiosulfatigenes DSM 11270]
MLDYLVIENIIQNSLKEDIGLGDLTTNSIFLDEEGTGIFSAKDVGIIAGLPLISQVWHKINPNLKFESYVNDGEEVIIGQKIAIVQGNIRSILTGERVALNFLQRLSGIATLTSKYVEEVKDYKVKVVDTRKTTPGLRVLEKYAVRKGGARNHRLSLDNAVMIKDNHIEGCGSITEAVRRVRSNIPITTKIEVETKNLREVEEALKVGVDIIMLDNMEPKMMEEAVIKIGGLALVEASGGINLKNIKEVAKTGVDIISVGELTHSAKALDISLNIKL